MSFAEMVFTVMGLRNSLEVKRREQKIMSSDCRTLGRTIDVITDEIVDILLNKSES